MKWLERAGITLVYGFLFLPIVVLIALSFNSATRGAAWEGFTFNWYSKLLEDEAILDALSNSLQIAVSACLLSAAFGLALGLALRKTNGSLTGRALTRSVMLPIILPDIVLGLSLLSFFVFLKLPLGQMSVILAHTCFGAAYVGTLVRARLGALDPLIEDAAADLGAGPWRTLFRVTLPQLYPALLSGVLMTFTLSFDDFSIAFFTAGVGATTLPLKIYSMLKFGVTPEVNALSALILCCSLILMTAAFTIRKKELA